MRALLRCVSDNELLLVEVAVMQRITNTNTNNIEYLEIEDVRGNIFKCYDMILCNRYSDTYETKIKELFTTGYVDLSGYLWDDFYNDEDGEEDEYDEDEEE